MPEPSVFMNGAAQLRNNAYWDTGDPADADDDVLMQAGDVGFDPTKIDTVGDSTLIEKTMRYRRK